MRVPGLVQAGTSNLQAAADWLSAHLWATGAANLAAPALEAARDWVAVHLQATTDWARAILAAGSEALRPYLVVVLAAAAPRWSEIIIAAGATAIGGYAVWALRSLRRRQRLQASLVEATLGHDPKTDWLELGIVMRNLQPYALLVHSLQVIDPPGTKICERWQAWQPAAVGVKFVAPDLELTNSVSIERTVLPYGSVNYLGETLSRRPNRKNAQAPGDGNGGPADELIRHFYLLPPRAPPAQRIAVRARLICELQTRRGRRQELAFRRTLTFAAPLRGREAAATRVS